MIRLAPLSSPPQVWAVEDTSVQITWGELPAGVVTATTGTGDRATLDHPGGPGGLVVDGLDPHRSYELDLRWAGGETRLEARTLTPPPGELLSRFATISDLHLGSRRWGALKTMIDRSGHEVPHPIRCATAAVDEALEWGAELLMIKGDAAHHEREEDFALVGQLVDRYEQLPMLLIPGNHDVDGVVPEAMPLTVGRRALPYTRRVDHIDLPGARVIAADTTLPGRGRGTIGRVADGLLDAVATADGGAFIGVHHQLMATRLPRHWPAGISAPASTRFLDRLARLGVPVTLSSGHTHRNRSRLHRDVLLTEVASTKDWPGVWAGYAVYEGGIRQVVRRVMRPDAIRWTEYSRGALLGLWSHWSPGPIEQRCLSRAWSRRTASV